jgi:ankyrin repeat protein
MLIEACFDPQWKENHTFNGLLYLAAKECSEDMLTLLIGKGLDVNIESHIDNQKGEHIFRPFISSSFLTGRGLGGIFESPGGTALHAASRTGKRAPVKLLLEAGANLAIKDRRGWMALHVAAREGHKDVVVMLLDAGAGVDTKVGEGLTALHLAAQRGNCEVVRALLARGASVDAPDDNGSTALHHTAKYSVSGDGFILGHLMTASETRQKQEETARLLLNCGANVDAVDRKGATSLHHSARAGNGHITHLILDHGADINSHDETGMTALHGAAVEGRDAIAAILMRRGANIDMRDRDGRTSLFAAAAGRHGEVCCRLVASGADVTTMCRTGVDGEIYPRLSELRRSTESWLRGRGCRNGIDSENANMAYKDE